MHSIFRKDKVTLSSSFQGRNLFYLVAFNKFFGCQGRQEGYGVKMADFQLHEHLLPCSLTNNSNVAFACPFCFSTEALNLEKEHGYILNSLILRKKLRKKNGPNISTRSSLFFPLAFNTVTLSSGWPRRLWNENGQLLTSCAFASVLAAQQ